MAIEIRDGFTLTLEEIQKLNEEISSFQETLEKLGTDDTLFFDTEDVRKVTGWSKKTVEDLFNHPAFPATDIGKRKLVLKPAFIRFFMDRRCKSDEKYWRYSA